MVNSFFMFFPKRLLSSKMKPSALPKYHSQRDFAEKHLRLVEMERQAEIDEQKELVANMSAEQLEKAGICMRRMHITSQAVALFGRNLYTFEPAPSKRVNLAAQANTVLSVGDIAGLCQAPNFGKTILSGVVTKVQDGKIEIAFDSLESKDDNLEFDPYEPSDIIKLAPDITYRRLKTGLENLQNLDHPLVEVFFQKRAPDLPANIIEPESIPEDAELGLNSSQKHAIVNCLAQPEVAVIHGPPGTGKTTTLAHFLSRAIGRGVKVLACAPSNVAVDNLAEKLLDLGVKKLIRLGHPARVMPRLQACTLDSLIQSSDIMEVCADIKKEISENSTQLLRSRDKGERWRLRGILRELRKDLSTRHKRAVKEVIQGADVVLATLTSLGNDEGVLAKNAKQMQFGLVAIDECSQALEAACWLALPLAPKCILAGDHLQLPPTITSEKAAGEGLAISLMERAVSFLPASTVTLLSVQYRMHVDIMEWSNRYLYASKLSAHESVAQHTLFDLLKTEKVYRSPVIFVDTAGCPECSEIPDPNDLSHGNPGEAVIVGRHVSHLVKDCGLEPARIGVISPYNHQVELIREQLAELLQPNQYNVIEVRSVDGFQGREKEAIILSLVRSNDEGVIGFLGEVRRLNVAITRARRQLFVVGDSETLKNGEHLANFVSYLYDKAEVHSASQYFETSLKSDKKPVQKLKDMVKADPPVKESVTVSVKRVEIKVEDDRKDSEPTGVQEDNEDEGVAQPRKSNRALKKERLKRQAEERAAAKAAENAEKSVPRPKTTSSEPPPLLDDPNALVVKPVPRAPLHQPGVSKAKGIQAGDVATKLALDKVEDPNDIDALCEAMQSLNSVCAFHQNEQLDACKKSVNVLAHFCRYCKRKFCLEHAQPEIHGCGPEAKLYETAQWRETFAARQRRENCLIPEKVAKQSLGRSVLEKRMDERLAKMKDERAGSNKNKKKK